jgi:hypothetical protein
MRKNDGGGEPNQGPENVIMKHLAQLICANKNVLKSITCHDYKPKIRRTSHSPN